MSNNNQFISPEEAKRELCLRQLQNKKHHLNVIKRCDLADPKSFTVIMQAIAALRT